MTILITSTLILKHVCKKIGVKNFVYDYIKSCGYQKNRLLNTIGDKQLYKKCIDNGIFDNIELARTLIDYDDKELMKKI